MELKNVIDGKINLIHKIKVILFNQHPDIFEEIDFENDRIYTDPFLFAAINSKHKPNISELLWGYKHSRFKENYTEVFTDNLGMFYISNVGYFQTKLSCSQLSINQREEKYHIKDEHGNEIEFSHSPLFFIHDNIELVLQPFWLLNEHFYDGHGNIVNIEISRITERNTHHLKRAFAIIKDVSPEFCYLLNICIKKIVIFKSNTYDLHETEIVERNSFATLSVHGCAFFNAFRESFNEIFFLEDIAHQSAHAILINFLEGRTDIFNINQDTVVDVIVDDSSGYVENRTLYVLFHALYTYYWIMKVLFDCYQSKSFNTCSEKEHEIIGRLYFAMVKFRFDYELITQMNSSNKFLKRRGKKIVFEINKLYNQINTILANELNGLSLDGQPYNFDFDIFKRNNTRLI